MGLQGNLEDLPLLDIIQIVSFSKKTGYLSIQMEGGDGAIVFVEGLVVAAFTANSPPADPRLGSLPVEARDRAVRDRIGFALEQLARLREGAFAFELTESVPQHVGARDIRVETLARGINPQELLLELAQGLDEDRAHSTAAVEASFAAPEEALVAEEPIVPAAVAAVDLPPPVRAPDPPRAPVAPASAPAGLAALAAPAVARESAPPPVDGKPARTILLVDDEQDVREILAQHFSAAGYTVEEAEDPEQAVKAAGRLRDASCAFVLVTDLGMPATGGASFHGGFEVVKRLWKMNLRPPVLMMTESLNQSLRLRAKQMGVKAFVFKPTLSKLNARQFEADLSAFAAKLVQDVLPRLSEAAALRAVVGQGRPGAAAVAAHAPDERGPAPAAEAGDADPSQPFEFLRRRLVELRQRRRRERDRDAGDEGRARVLRARDPVRGQERRGARPRRLRPRAARRDAEPRGAPGRDPARPSPRSSATSACRARPFTGPLPQDRWAGHLIGRIGRFQSREVALLPLVAHRETIALLFGDNPESGRPPERLAAFELFVEQAGIALENVFLQRKLQTIEDKDRAGLR